LYHRSAQVAIEFPHSAGGAITQDRRSSDPRAKNTLRMEGHFERASHTKWHITFVASSKMGEDGVAITQSTVRTLERDGAATNAHFGKVTKERVIAIIAEHR